MVRKLTKAQLKCLACPDRLAYNNELNKARVRKHRAKKKLMVKK